MEEPAWLEENNWVVERLGKRRHRITKKWSDDFDKTKSYNAEGDVE